MRMLLGLARPTSGRGLILGHSYPHLARPAHDVGVLLDANVFHPKRTARNQLRWVMRASRLPMSRIDQALAAIKGLHAMVRAQGRTIGSLEHEVALL
jgi:ABC-2 type transport system ATP-binding protein